MPHLPPSLFFVSTLLWVFIITTAIVFSVVMILENHSPQSTLAWLMLFFALPFLGVVIYILFGRDHHALARNNRALRQEVIGTLRRNPDMASLLQRQPAELEQLRTSGPPLYGRILSLMSRNAITPVFSHNALEILQNGSEKYPRLRADLKTAQHSIHMEYFEWSSDEMMQEFKQILIERAKAGVQVRILYDPLGCLLMLKQQYVKEMNAGGVHMLPWAPLYNLHTISYRSHRKIVVIDGTIAYTGGLNMTEEYLNGPKSGNFGIWRDTHMRVIGEVVLGLQGSFAVQWYNTTAEQLTAPEYYPPLTETPAYLPLQIVNSGPDSEWKAIRRLYFGLITAATDHIYMQSPYFILDDGLIEALSTAARSGVDVKVMIAADGPGGSFPYWAGYTYAANVARAGVKVYFYMKGYLHAKTIAVDSALCSIGSANLDIRSFRINYELNLIIYDEKTTRQLEADFLEDFKECVPFDLAEYRKSNVVGRARDSFFRLLSPLL
jgi:cardiolipin synthase A/B